MLYLKAFWLGIRMAFEQYMEMIQENKWYLILLLIDILLIPVKIVIIIPMLCFRKGREIFTKIGKDGLGA